jgi:hypothetical protein
VEARFSQFFYFLYFYLNNDCSNLWIVDVIRFLTLRFMRMSLGMSFLLPRLRKMSYLCIELNLSRTNMVLQLKISHELVNIIIINRF